MLRSTSIDVLLSIGFFRLCILLFSFNVLIVCMGLSVEQTLDTFHQAASNADGETYFNLFASNGYFIGTDVTERWNVEEFRKYAEPYFSKGHGWTYVPKKRYVNYNTEQTVAWFDEVLDSKRFGVMARGSGVLIKEPPSNNWKIAQYHLTIPVPNDLMDKVAQMIRDDSSSSANKN